MYAAHGSLPAQMKNSTRAWISRVISSGHAGAGLEGLPFDVVLEEAAFEGVLPLLAWRLRQSHAWPELPAALRDGLERGAREAAVAALHRDAQLRRVSTCLASQGIASLLLKGPAFGRWLYPQPYLRVSGDVDLLFSSRVVAEQAAEALARIGFVRAFSPTSMTYEMSSRLWANGRVVLELDLHSRLVNVPAFMQMLTFDELWESSVALPEFGQELRVLCPLHAFVHACIHRAVDLYLQAPPMLKWVYDIHLMIERMDTGGWDGFLQLVRAKRASGVCLRSILDAVAEFDSPVQVRVLDALHRQAAEEPIDWRRLHDWRYMQWQNLKALPGTGAKLRWLCERVFPTQSHLRELHGEGSWSTLMLRRMGRGLSRLRNKA